jgi:hypothetical protein
MHSSPESSLGLRGDGLTSEDTLFGVNSHLPTDKWLEPAGGSRLFAQTSASERIRGGLGGERCAHRQAANGRNMR